LSQQTWQYYPVLLRISREIAIVGRPPNMSPPSRNHHSHATVTVTSTMSLYSALALYVVLCFLVVAHSFLTLRPYHSATLSKYQNVQSVSVSSQQQQQQTATAAASTASFGRRSMKWCSPSSADLHHCGFRTRSSSCAAPLLLYSGCSDCWHHDQAPEKASSTGCNHLNSSSFSFQYLTKNLMRP
jgi:hypothetical protein